MPSSRLRGAAGAAALALAAAALSLVGPPPASAATSAWAWVHADAPTTPSYSARGQSATGARPQVVRHGTGDYSVSVRGITSGGDTVMVTAEDLSVSRQCSVASWLPTAGGNLEARVLCSDLTGQPADSRSYAAFVARSGTERGSWLCPERCRSPFPHRGEGLRRVGGPILVTWVTGLTTFSGSAPCLRRDRAS